MGTGEKSEKQSEEQNTSDMKGGGKEGFNWGEKKTMQEREEGRINLKTF